MQAEHIENIKGESGKIYSFDLFFKYPYEEDINEQNCICLFITRHNTKKIISCFIEFKDIVDNKTYETLDINGFLPYGIAIIKSTETDSKSIIEDLKDNKDFYFEKPPKKD